MQADGTDEHTSARRPSCTGVVVIDSDDESERSLAEESAPSPAYSCPTVCLPLVKQEPHCMDSHTLEDVVAHEKSESSGKQKIQRLKVPAGDGWLGLAPVAYQLRQMKRLKRLQKQRKKAREEAKEKKTSVKPHILHDCGEFATLAEEGRRFPSCRRQRKQFETEDVCRFKTMLDEFGYRLTLVTNEETHRVEKALFKRVAEIGLKARFLDELLMHDAKKLKKAKKMIQDMLLVELRKAVSGRRIKEFDNNKPPALRKIPRELRKGPRGCVGDAKIPLVWMRRRAGNRSDLLDEMRLDPVCIIDD